MKTPSPRHILSFAALVTLGGCLCGGYSGAGDRLYRRGNDTIIFCTNGGYAATIGTTNLEGWYTEAAANAFVASVGTSGARAFELAATTDGRGFISAQLGEGWDTMTLDQTALDHADVQCTDLDTRSWWTASTNELPVATAFEHQVFPSMQECLDAQAAGTYPENALCADELLLCPNGVVHQASGDTGGAVGTYTAELGSITVTANQLGTDQAFGGFDAMFAADGTLVEAQSHTLWKTVPTSAIAGNLACD